MLKATLTYSAKNAEEFKSLVNWMTGDDKDVSVSVTPPSSGHGAFVTQYLTLKGEQRFRLSAEEKEEYGGDREGAAKARLAALGELGGWGDMAEMPEDDGEDTFGES